MKLAWGATVRDIDPGGAKGREGYSNESSPWDASNPRVMDAVALLEKQTH